MTRQSATKAQLETGVMHLSGRASAQILFGVDVAEIRRFKSGTLPERFVGRFFTDAEGQALQQRGTARQAEFIAGRFAAKEAAIKALRLSLGNGSVLRDIEITCEANGAPSLKLFGEALEAAQSLRVTRPHVSISHDAGLACAVVILERHPGR